jgi:threonine dehydrogenase-like Zn-dependent dehydrogenase
MKSVIYKGPGEFAFEDRPEPSIQHEDDVKIKVLGVCICGTDINIFATPQKHPSRPGIIFGHEFCGQVVEVGSSVAKLKPGDKVIIDPHGPCGICDACLAGWPERCENLYLSEPGYEGQANAMGVFKDGGLTSYTVVPDKFAYKIAQETPAELMALAEPLACCGYSLEKLNIHVGDSVCVLGAGPIGQLYVALAKANGASKIIVSEPIAYRRNKALEIGATRVVDPGKEDIAKVCMEETDGLGVDHCIEAVAAMLMDAIACVRSRGKVLQCGHDEITVAPVRVGEVLKKEVEIHGVFLGKYYMAKTARIIESGILPLEKIVTHTFPISEYGKALDLARSGQCIKVVVIPE